MEPAKLPSRHGTGPRTLPLGPLGRGLRIVRGTGLLPWRRELSPGWSVCALADEPLALLCAFVGHYLDLGAAEVRVFMDRPDAEVTACLGAVPGVQVTQCDDAFWTRTAPAGRPVEHPERQKLCYDLAYAEARHEWMLFCDADEFVVVPERLGAVLDRQAPDVDLLRIPVAERTFLRSHPPQSVFDGEFRFPIDVSKDVARQVFGKRARFLAKGLFGHSSGKAVLRARRPYRTGIHHPIPLTPGPRGAELLATPAFLRFVPDAALAHFDGMTPLHWAIKLLLKYNASVEMAGRDDPAELKGRTPARRAQIRALARSRDDPERLARLLQLPLIPRNVASNLRRQGGLFPLDLDPAGSARRHFPDVAFDFSVEAFDRALRQLHAGLLAQGIGGRPIAL